MKNFLKSTLAVAILAAGSPAMASQCIDNDGDGWGWDGSASCLVAEFEPNDTPNDCIDNDGDGWGWDGVRSCLVAGVEGDGTDDAIDGESGSDAETATAQCIDTDGDGWGWDGAASCLVPDVNTDEPDNGELVGGDCVDEDGDGWGWDGVESCVIDVAIADPVDDGADDDTTDDAVDDGTDDDTTDDAVEDGTEDDTTDDAVDNGTDDDTTDDAVDDGTADNTGGLYDYTGLSGSLDHLEGLSDLINPEDPTTFEFANGPNPSPVNFEGSLTVFNLYASNYMQNLLRVRVQESAPPFNYAIMMGQIPENLWSDLDSLYILDEDQALRFESVPSDVYLAIGETAALLSFDLTRTLEEEVMHQLVLEFAGDVTTSAEWQQAIFSDDAILVDVEGVDNQAAHDYATSMMYYLALRYRSDRVDSEILQHIQETIPARIQYFDTNLTNVFPF